MHYTNTTGVFFINNYFVDPEVAEVHLLKCLLACPVMVLLDDYEVVFIKDINFDLKEVFFISWNDENFIFLIWPLLASSSHFL